MSTRWKTLSARSPTIHRRRTSDREARCPRTGVKMRRAARKTRSFTGSPRCVWKEARPKASAGIDRGLAPRDLRIERCANGGAGEDGREALYDAGHRREPVLGHVDDVARLEEHVAAVAVPERLDAGRVDLGLRERAPD